MRYFTMEVFRGIVMQLPHDYVTPARDSWSPPSLLPLPCLFHSKGRRQIVTCSDESPGHTSTSTGFPFLNETKAQNYMKLVMTPGTIFGKERSRTNLAKQRWTHINYKLHMKAL